MTDFVYPDVEGLRKLFAEVSERPRKPYNVSERHLSEYEIFAKEAAGRIEFGSSVATLARLYLRMKQGEAKDLEKAQRRGLKDPVNSKEYAISAEAARTAQHALKQVLEDMLPDEVTGATRSNYALYLAYEAVAKADE